MINPRQRFSLSLPPEWRSAVLATGIVGLIATGSKAFQTITAAARADISASSPSIPQKFTPAVPSPSLPRGDLSHTRPQSSVATTEGSPANNGAPELAQHVPEPVVESPSPESGTPLIKPASHQIASVDPSDVNPDDSANPTTSVEIDDECMVVDICVDRYLWALYQRTPKEDTLNTTERRKVAVKRKGRIVHVFRAFTKHVPEDFGWKDVQAAERADKPMMDYVIGGMDRSFKLKLFYMLHAAEAAGLSPGITSGFRDDYRQSIASGLKAASNRSYHGGSLRGGYGHGLAADLVSLDGSTRDERFASSIRLWKWIDVHGPEFGIGRPYLSRDPPHVAPINGEEYAKHRRRAQQTASNMKKIHSKKLRSEAARIHSRPANRPKTAAASKPKAS